jgi:hypothetical protein
MADIRTVQHCHWARPTLFRDDPGWTEADAYPWSCVAEGDPQVVEEPELCLTCGLWAPHHPRDCGLRTTDRDE